MAEANACFAINIRPEQQGTSIRTTVKLFNPDFEMFGLIFGGGYQKAVQSAANTTSAPLKKGAAAGIKVS